MSIPDSRHLQHETLIDLLVLKLAGEQYALPSAYVREVVRYRPWTVVPGAPHTLPGIISQRGLILPVADIRPLLNAPEVEPQRSARLVVLHVQNIDLALLAEAVLDLITLDTTSISMPATSDQPQRRYVRSIAEWQGEPLALLDMEAVLQALAGEG